MEHVPANDLAIVVPDWIELSEKPPIASICLAQPQLQRICGVAVGIFAPASPIVWVNDCTGSRILSPLFKCEARVIKSSAVGIDTLEGGPEYDDELRGEVQHL